MSLSYQKTPVLPVFQKCEVLYRIVQGLISRFKEKNIFSYIFESRYKNRALSRIKFHKGLMYRKAYFHRQSPQSDS